jgi:hypothetical protein
VHPIDRTILTFCRDDFRPLKPLRQTIPGGSLYRHVQRLVDLGWLRKERGLYRATEAGLRQLADADADRRWDGLVHRYAPLGLVPTPVHRAMAELILAAVIARQHVDRPDRHPFFVAFGRTLHWKTSLGVFLCHALGLDPAMHVVDCGTESGKSLAVRSGTGTPVFTRELLGASFLVLDEVLAADPAVRTTLGLFLSGRRRVPFENEQLEVHPVPLLTLNPRDKDTLEGRIGLSAPQIRRALLANLDAVPMPDLATLGERALTAARTQGPLTLEAPRADCQSFHQRIVELTRALLQAEASERVDVEVVVTLCTGMTALLSQPVEAIAQVGYDLGLLAETLGWTRPGWIEAVTQFSLDGASPRPLASPAALPAASPTTPARASAAPAISLQLLPRPRRAVEFLDLSLSDDLRARLVWFAVDSGRPLEEALGRLLDFYRDWDADDTLDTMDKILELADALDVAQVDADTLHDYLQARAALAEKECTVADVPEALRLIRLLDDLPAPWSWAQADAEVEALAALLAADIGVEEVATFIARHQRLAALGFNEAIAEAVATALAESGAIDDRRDAVLRALVALAGQAVDRTDLEAAVSDLKDEIATLEAQRDRLRRSVQGLRTRLGGLQEQARTVQAHLAELRVEGDGRTLASKLAAFLTQRTPEGAAFVTGLNQFILARQAGRPPDAPEVARLAGTLVGQLCALFQELQPLLFPDGQS